MHLICVCLCVCSSVGRMAMQFVAAQMMSTVWNGPSTSQVMKPSVRRGNDSLFRSKGNFFF